MAFSFPVLAAALLASNVSGPATEPAQEPAPAEKPTAQAVTPASLDAAAIETQAEPSDQAADQAPAEISEEADAPNPDEMADLLNSQQQLQQTYTFTRTIDGKVVQREQRTITFDRNDPVRPSESGPTPLEQLKAAFDGELLTRAEALDEATLDFTLADANRDEKMTAEEFAALMQSHARRAEREAGLPDDDRNRQRQYEAFIAEIAPEAAMETISERATRKFSFMAGAATSISRKDYIAEYLLDFDAMDKEATPCSRTTS